MRDEKEISSRIESNADKLFGKDWLSKLIYSSGYMDGIAYADNYPNWEEIVERMWKEVTNDLRNDKWVSVKEELPKINPNDSEWEYSDDVIVALKDSSIAVGRYERDNSTGEHYWMLYGVDKDLIVTHWMHSPQAPLVTDLNKEDLPPLSCQEGNILVEEEENDIKATDLMLGDLVIHGFGEAGRITEICQNSVVIEADSFDVGDGMSEVSFAINEIKPIPLTAEILDKNFNSTEIPDDPYGAYFYESNEYVEVYIKEYTDGLWEVVVDEIEFSPPSTWKMYVSDVHQLQHALRLSGINKVIEI